MVVYCTAENISIIHLIYSCSSPIEIYVPGKIYNLVFLLANINTISIFYRKTSVMQLQNEAVT